MRHALWIAAAVLAPLAASAGTPEKDCRSRFEVASRLPLASLPAAKQAQYQTLMADAQQDLEENDEAECLKVLDAAARLVPPTR